ncbi:nucleotidyltransferase domain-containing protein [Sulfurovum sp.]|uniref:nucleotidyltransferase family protein n=1 Tax=Sulfurovum sp. TaxID=1969726 RepID=UPI0025EE624D|nr:nucleotidyltransferase domain-containing protein [Sulfurovum sp.]
MITQSDILSYLAAHKDEFLHRFGITRIGLFGSFSRGTPNDNSDIDILIELRNGVEDIYRKKQQFRQMLETYFQRNVDIAREKYLSDLARKTIEDDVIYV